MSVNSPSLRNWEHLERTILEWATIFLLFQSTEISACRNFEGDQNIFVRGSRNLPLKIYPPTCIACLVTGDTRPVMQKLTCKDIHVRSLLGHKPNDDLLQLQWQLLVIYLKKVDVVNESKFIPKSLDKFIKLRTYVFIYIFSPYNTSF